MTAWPGVAPLRGKSAESEVCRLSQTPSKNYRAEPHHPRSKRVGYEIMVELNLVSLIGQVLLHHGRSVVDIRQATLHHDQEPLDNAASTKLPLETLAVWEKAFDEVGRGLAHDHHTFWKSRKRDVPRFEFAALDTPSFGKMRFPRMGIGLIDVGEKSY